MFYFDCVSFNLFAFTHTYCHLQALKDVLLHKAKEWKHRHGESPENIKEFSSKIDGPGLFVFKHKDHQCFQFIGRADKIFSKCGEKLKAAFEGSLHEPLAALLIISMASDWDFYFMPVGPQGTNTNLRTSVRNALAQFERKIGGEQIQLSCDTRKVCKVVARGKKLFRTHKCLANRNLFSSD